MDDSDHRRSACETSRTARPISIEPHQVTGSAAFLVEETGECDERSLKHNNGEAEKFYRDLKARGISVRVGMETTGYSRDQSQHRVSAFLDAIGPMTSECVDRSGPSDDLTTVRDAARDDVFLPSF